VWGTIAGLTLFVVISVARVVAIAFPDIWPMVRPWNAWGEPRDRGDSPELAYAIVKHHVFDITVVVRRGLQYASREERAARAPAAAGRGLAYGIVVQNQPVAQLCAPTPSTCI